MNSKIQTWFNDNQPKEEMIYKNAMADQFIFIRDKICGILARSYEEYKGIQQRAEIISTHTSKSVKLPVYDLYWNDCRFIMRDNFHDWKVSVRLPFKFKEIKIDFMNLFNPTQEINSIYCEGFKDNWVYGPYSKDTREFTIELGNNYHLFTFFWIVKHNVLSKE